MYPRTANATIRSVARLTGDLETTCAMIGAHSPLLCICQQHLPIVARDHQLGALDRLLNPFISMRCPAVDSSNNENQVAAPQLRPVTVQG